MFFDALLPLQGELAGRTIINIIQQPNDGHPDTVALPKEHELVPKDGQISNKIKVTKQITLNPNLKFWSPCISIEEVSLYSSQ